MAARSAVPVYHHRRSKYDPFLEYTKRIKVLVERNGRPAAHRKALEAVRKLQLQLEALFDTALRFRRQAWGLPLLGAYICIHA